MTIFSELATEPGAPSAQRVETFLRERIEGGTLVEGTRLPPVREAAWQLGCAPGTVSRAYQALTVAGLVRGQVGRGTFVGLGAGAGSPTRLSHMRDEEADRFVDMAINTFLMEPADALIADALEAAASRVRAGTARLGYFGIMGDPADRAAALPLLARWRRQTTVESVALFNGAQSIFSAAFTGLMRPGTAIAADALTYPGVMAAAELAGRRVIPIEGDDDGMLPETLEAACKAHAIALVCLMPGIHNPTGATMPQARREALAAVAERCDLTVLEDEVYGFLLDDDAPSFSQLLPARAVVGTSLSKCVAPALHVGYATGPTGLVRRLAAAQNAMALMVPPLMSAAATHVLTCGALEPRIAAIRDGVARRADHLVAHLPGLRRERLQGGVAWMPVPDEWRVADFCREAEAQGVRVGDGAVFAVERTKAPQTVRMSFSAVEGEARFKAAVATLEGLVKQPLAGGQALP